MTPDLTDDLILEALREAFEFGYSEGVAHPKGVPVFDRRARVADAFVKRVRATVDPAASSRSARPVSGDGQ
jgi:hypothetical protein